MAGSDIFPRAVRLHGLIRAGQRINANRAAALFEVSPRHAQRIFDYLKDRLMAPLEYDRHRRSYYYSDPTFDLPAAIMTEGEAIGLILAHESVLRRQGTPLGRRLQSAVEKLRVLLPDSISVDVASLMTQVSFVPNPARLVSDTILETMALSLEKRETVHIEYYAPSADRLTSRDVDVYHLTQLRGDWYAVAWCHLRQALRTFALSRVQAAGPVTGQHYHIPSSFSAAAYFKDALGVESSHEPVRIALRFDAHQARWVSERTWHPTQRTTLDAAGRLTLELDVSLSMELRQWILSYGRHVEVLEPASLRQEVVDEVAAMQAAYASSRTETVCPT